MKPANLRTCSNLTGRRCALAIGIVAIGVAGCSMSADSNASPDAELSDLTSFAVSGTWSFHSSEITGGGLANQIAVHPTSANSATIGGDSWGLFNTRTQGDLWLGAMKAGGTAASAYTGDDGEYYSSGLAYSLKNPNIIYALVGRIEGTATQGGFVAVKGNTVQLYNHVSSTAPVCPGGSEPNWNRSNHPRPKGKLLVDYDVATATEYIYAGGGNGTGIFRSTDAGASWIKLGLSSLSANDFITGMALDPGNPQKLVITTKGTPNSSGVSAGQEFILTGVRGSPNAVNQSSVNLGGKQFESITRIGTALWVAARRDGIYRSTTGGASWTPVYAAKGDDTTTIGGAQRLIVAACTSANTGRGTADCVYRSTNGGSSWDYPFTTASQNYAEWGTNQKWWHADSIGAMPSGTSYVANDIKVATDGTTVYMAGRAGVWISRDSGASFRPDVAGLSGTMHNHFGVSGTTVMVDDVDFTCETTPTSAHYDTSSLIGDPTATAACSFGPGGTMTATGGGHTIFVTSPTLAGETSHFYVDCPGGHLNNCTSANDRADDWYKSTIIKPSDVLFANGYFYIAQYGGGVILAHLN
ncbi:hypothetical protein BH11MYX1_BH11MYX1_36070 [soil metagenome]